MTIAPHYRSREEVFDYLDDYAFNRKEEIERLKLGKEVGLIKSYVLETSSEDDLRQKPEKITKLFGGAGWRSSPIDGAGFHTLRDQQDDFGFLEVLSGRHIALYSHQDSKRADSAIDRLVRNTPKLDFLWLSGDTFTSLWQYIIMPQMPDRFVSMKFEHLSKFENNFDESATDDEDEVLDWNADEVIERRASTSSITETASRLRHLLPRLQELHPPFRAIKMLRMPSGVGRGGYEFWSWGKVTHRAPSFRDGREQVVSVTKIYEEITRAIEGSIWFDVEQHTVRELDGITLRGAPVVFEFQVPLSAVTFRNLVTVTFEHGQGPLRLWGKPIWLGDSKVHVYGLDMHLWQRIYLELTPRRIVAILPKGTCGNSVHRLITNIQRYVDPQVNVSIGDISYSDLFQQILLGKLAPAPDA